DKNGFSPGVRPARTEAIFVAGTDAAGQRAAASRAARRARADLPARRGLLPALLPRPTAGVGSPRAVVPRLRLLLVVLRRHAGTRPAARGPDGRTAAPGPAQSRGRGRQQRRLPA